MSGHAIQRLVRELTDSLLTIINDVLDVSKLEAGRLDLEVIDLDIGEVRDHLRNRPLSRRGLTLQVFWGEPVNQFLYPVRGNALHLNRVLALDVG